MFGYAFTCSACDFEFHTGWSHHLAGQSLLCGVCATHYLAGEGASPWGAVAGERLQLLRWHYVKRRKRHELRATGISLLVSKAPPPDTPAGVFYLLGESLRDVACQSCGTSGSIVETLTGRDACPKCKAGRIKEPHQVIY